MDLYVLVVWMHNTQHVKTRREQRERERDGDREGFVVFFSTDQTHKTSCFPSQRNNKKKKRWCKINGRGVGELGGRRRIRKNTTTNNWAKKNTNLDPHNIPSTTVEHSSRKAWATRTPLAVLTYYETTGKPSCFIVCMLPFFFGVCVSHFFFFALLACWSGPLLRTIVDMMVFFFLCCGMKEKQKQEHEPNNTRYSRNEKWGTRDRGDGDGGRCRLWFVEKLWAKANWGAKLLL